MCVTTRHILALVLRKRFSLSLSQKKIAVQAECDAAVVGGLRSIISKAAETLS